MAGNSTIEWTDKTWNPVVGFKMVSSGCVRCYAETMANRLRAMAEVNPSGRLANYLHVVNDDGRWNGNIRLVEEALGDPLKWRKPATIFVNSMSDLFHEGVPLDFIQRVFDAMRRAHWHRFQVLTKRSERLLTLDPWLNWPENVWMGVSVEDGRCVQRIDHLRGTQARTKFLSLEPLLGPLPSLRLDRIDWVIVGGESGPGARPMEASWVRDLRNQCVGQSVPFFFKQWGGVNKKKAGREIDGRTWNEMPGGKEVAHV